MTMQRILGITKLGCGVGDTYPGSDKSLRVLFVINRSHSVDHVGSDWFTSKLMAINFVS
jgi:hypothetical protein